MAVIAILLLCCLCHSTDSNLSPKIQRQICSAAAFVSGSVSSIVNGADPVTVTVNARFIGATSFGTKPPAPPYSHARHTA